MTKKAIVPSVLRSTPVDREDVKVGQWYWVKHVSHDKVESRDFMCVGHIGTNFVGMLLPGYRGGQNDERIHFDEFDAQCELEPNPEKVIGENLAESRGRVGSLMREVNELTARLALTNVHLKDGNEGAALALIDQSVPAEEHKAALVKAKEETLPELFKAIESANQDMAVWMTASIVPLRAEMNGMKKVVERIEGRIFNVELYAGLSEQVVLIRDGRPGELGEKVHLMQRRHYMDEECLARYEVGGMEFKDLEAFDLWMARPENADRLLPHQKCVVAMKVRREKKHREAWSLFGFIQMFHMEQEDKTTFLYIRNGEKIYRMNTRIEFDEKLFPDMGVANQSSERRWAKTFVGLTDDPLITEGEYLEIKREDEEAERKRKIDYKNAPKKERWQFDAWRFRPKHTEYIPFDQSHVLYDDIMNRERKIMEKHNRIVLILQGLLDRSEVLHPHPPWKIWTEDGFRQALELEYDESRALTSGEKPDFQAYRERLNKTIKAGTVTIGQERAWMRREADRENARRSRDWKRNQNERDLETFQPYGDPGPGKLAHVASATKTGKITYEWERRKRSDWRERGEMIPATLTVESKKVLNVDAYTPGDFHIFFDDPRTRAEYLRWAPLLLEAEEFKAGNRKVGTEKT